MQCPKCRLENPANTTWCDCGYNFSSGQVKRSQAPRTPSAPNSSGDGYFSFRKLVSPSIIKVVHVLGMIALFGAGITLILQAVQAEPGDKRLVLSLYGIGAITLGNLAWRILCEQAILLFSIHEILASIEQLLGKR